VKAYYDRRAPGCDDWWLDHGSRTDRERPGWEDELRLLEGVIRGLRPARALDVACGEVMFKGRRFVVVRA
jgi:hypothetical protein